MKWVTKLQENNIQEGKLNKTITAKIKDFKEIQQEIKDLESNRNQVSADDMDEFNSDLKELKSELDKSDMDICAAIDKVIERMPMMAEKVRKMAEARKSKGGQASAPKPAAQPKAEAQPQQQQQAPTPTPAQQQASGGQVEEKNEGGSWGKWILGGALVILTGGAAYNYFKNK
jgi:hypothetical protein